MCGTLECKFAKVMQTSTYPWNEVYGIIIWTHGAVVESDISVVKLKQRSLVSLINPVCPVGLFSNYYIGKPVGTEFHGRCTTDE